MDIRSIPIKSTLVRQFLVSKQTLMKKWRKVSNMPSKLLDQLEKVLLDRMEIALII